MKFLTPVFIFAISFFSTLKTTAQKNTFKDSVTLALGNAYTQAPFTGFGTAVVTKNGMLYQQGTGYADKAAKKKYTANTIQNIGSISKTFIGVALLKAQEMGKLKLDDAINTYLPFKVSNPHHPQIPMTIRQLATHTSSIADNEFYLKKNYILKPGQNLKGVKLNFDDEQVFNTHDAAISMKAFLQNVLTSNGKWYSEDAFTNNKPGEIFEYSNVGATLAAYIIECATGVPFDKFTAQYILQPLGMKASGWNFAAVNFKQHSRLYQTPDTVLPYYYLITYPDGNFISSVNDMGKYLAELMKGYDGEGTLLKKESYAALFKPQLTAKNFVKRNEKNPYSDTYNTGIFMGFSVSGNIGHTGSDPGVSTIMFFNPQTKIGRLLIVNTNIMDKKGNNSFYAIWDVLEKYQYKL